MSSVSTPHPPGVATYQLKLTNSTSQTYTLTIKFPNLPSPTPQPQLSHFPIIFQCILLPSKDCLWSSGISSDSQQAHLFLITATPTQDYTWEEDLLGLDHDVLVNIWKDTGGTRGDYASVHLLPGRDESSIVNAAWEVRFSWQSWMGAKQLAPGEVRTGSGEGGKMLYIDK